MEESELEVSIGSNENLVAYRLGKVEKAVDHTNSKLEILVTMSTSIETLKLRVNALETWKKNVVAYLVALSLLVIGALVGMTVK